MEHACKKFGFDFNLFFNDFAIDLEYICNHNILINCFSIDYCHPVYMQVLMVSDYNVIMSGADLTHCGLLMKYRDIDMG